MIGKFKHNTKIKVISLITAFALWVYVMYVVDPSDKELLRGIPVYINNMSEITSKDLVPYPEKDYKADLYVSGSLSKIRNIDKDKLDIYGVINNPKEGKNNMYLRANMSDNVATNFKTNTIIVNLEKVIKKKKKVKINIEGKNDNAVGNIKSEFDEVSVSGPRTLVNNVKNIVANININGVNSNFTRQVSLTPVDDNNKEVSGVTMGVQNMSVDVEILNKKQVPIKLNADNSNVNLNNFTLSSDKVTIEGEDNVISKINSIETEKFDFSKINTSEKIELNLVIPDGIKSNIKSIFIQRNNNNGLT